MIDLVPDHCIHFLLRAVVVGLSNFLKVALLSRFLFLCVANKAHNNYVYIAFYTKRRIYWAYVHCFFIQNEVFIGRKSIGKSSIGT